MSVFITEFDVWIIEAFILSYVLLQPEDWDEEEDGEWTVPTIPNPEYKGPWKQKVCLIEHDQRQS